MDATIGALIGSIITGVCGVIGQYFISVRQAKENAVKAAQREQRQNDRMEVVEKKLDIHNGYAQRFEHIETDIAKIQKDIEYIRKDA